MPNMSQQFNKFREAVHKAKKVESFDGWLLSLDPGETTGWAVWKCEEGGTAVLVDQGQIATWPLEMCVENVDALFTTFPLIRHVVHETYAVYEWKSSDHSWSQIPTVQIIGSILTLCIQRRLTYSQQTAQIAKNFCTNEKLTSWGLYQKGQRHAVDAIRHGAYFILFTGQQNTKAAN